MKGGRDEIESTTLAVTIDGKTYETTWSSPFRRSCDAEKQKLSKNSMVPRMCFQKSRQEFFSFRRKGGQVSLARGQMGQTCTYHRKLKPISKERAADSC